MPSTHYTFPYNLKSLVFSARGRDANGVQTPLPPGVQWSLSGIDGVTDVIAPDGSTLTAVNLSPGTLVCSVSVPAADPGKPPLVSTSTVVLTPLPVAAIELVADAVPSPDPGSGPDAPSPGPSPTPTPTPALADALAASGAPEGRPVPLPTGPPGAPETAPRPS